MARKLVLAGSKKPQMQRTSGRNWTKEKEREFLSVLAETCNVTRAAEAVGMSSRGAYKRRKTHAAFRAAWIEALATAYQRLELVLLDRVFNGTEKVVKKRDGSEERMLEYSNQLGLSLLKMHRETAGEANGDPAEGDVEDVRERLLGKLKRLQHRREQEKAQSE